MSDGPSGSSSSLEASADDSVGGKGFISAMRPWLLLGGAYAMFMIFVCLAWWVAWRLSLSKVPILREVLRECFGASGDAKSASKAEGVGTADRKANTEGKTVKQK
eukprot:TRINITY_DN23227_c0_g1_i1.p1 TRINITY_DN23227_c0_g1~~TRINITY_DN23227_c0_g1_i1.p1  ORF type:complete len:105 (-),score=16.33 TRINITY_DN23227_c0_g1_i1:333-647(-)